MERSQGKRDEKEKSEGRKGGRGGDEIERKRRS